MAKLRISLLSLFAALTALRLWNHQWWFGLGSAFQTFVDPYYGNSLRRRQLQEAIHKPREFKYFNLLSLIKFRDPKSVSFREQTIDELAQHDGEALCIASVHNGEISAASVINEQGAFVNLALPNNYAAELNVDCTRTDQRTGNVATDAENTYIINREVNSGVREIVMDEFDCHPKSFQPGYYDHKTSMWHDRCNGLEIDTDFRKPEPNTMFTPLQSYGTNPFPPSQLQESGPCPILDRKKDDLWISIIGDSVTRMIFLNGLKWSHLDYRTWDPYDVLGFGNQQTFILTAVEVGNNQRVWFSFTFEYMTPTSGQVIVDNAPDNLVVKMPYTWGDFLDLSRGGSPGDNEDPSFSRERVPDTVIFSPGYHSTLMDAREFGQSFSDILSQWENTMNERNLPIPPVHVTLNMMPAPWMIPEKYADDRSRRTELNEYRKNLAIVETVQRHEFVRSVLDFFSPELMFNGKVGDTVQVQESDSYHALPGKLSAHKDAVHLGGEWGLRVMIIAGSLMVHALCNSD